MSLIQLKAERQHHISQMKLVTFLKRCDRVRNSLNIYLTETITFAHEFKFSINNYLKNDVRHANSTVKRNIFTLADIIKYNEMNPVIEGYGQSALKLSEATDGLRNRTYLNARIENRRKSIMFLESFFKKYDVDALATPCDSDDSVNLFMYGAFAGYPSITVRNW